MKAKPGEEKASALERRKLLHFTFVPLLPPAWNTDEMPGGEAAAHDHEEQNAK